MKRRNLRVGSCDVLLLGTVHGFVPDAQELQEALEETAPELVALGVPPEDLAGLAALASGDDVELPDLDPQSQRLLELLDRFGPTRIPSPDLEAAHAWATGHDRPLEALDLDDEAHAELYIQHVKLRHVIRSSSINKKLLSHAFDAPDADALQVAWDAAQNRLPPLQRIEQEREAHMARRIREMAHGHATMAAVVPVARFDGIAHALA